MARLYLVRHGKASASWADAADPGLDDTGRAEAEAAAQQLAQLGPLPIFTSPLARARETAAPLERLWEGHARIETGIAEVPSPDQPLETRGDWLRGLMTGTWEEADQFRRTWRQTVVDTLIRQPRDAVFFSHFVAINVAYGAAIGDDKVTLFSPANGSVTILETDGKQLSLVEKGREAVTVVR